MRSSVMQLLDGRTVSWAELGRVTASTVLVHAHGSPSSRLEMAILDDVYAELGIRVVAPDRPGYGGSTARDQGRTVAEWTLDVVQILDKLGIEDFAVSGYSGGGPHALAIAASPVLAPRVTRVLLRAALAPDQDPTSALDVEILERAGHVSWSEFEDWYEGGAENQVKLAPADEQAFADPAFAEAAMATLAEAQCQGTLGDASDQWAFATPWGVDFASITQPVAIWHGGVDTMVPVSHAHELDARLRNSTLRVLPDDGHFSIALRIPEQLQTLTDR